MRCPLCLTDNQLTTKRCQCGFPFDDVPVNELDAWFTEYRQVLEAAYLAAPTPWQGSGKSGTFEDWTRLRIPNLAPVDRPGTYLDIGCANGFLLECLVAWARLKETEITPYGLDYSAQLVDRARERLPAFASNLFVGNAWDWAPPMRFDYARTELDYVPRNYRQEYIEHLLDEFLAPKGKLILSHYRSHREDLRDGWINADLVAWGFEIERIYSGYAQTGLELCRVAVLKS